MTWVKLDDAFPDHPKFLRAGPLAGYLMLCSIAWSNRNLTDGFIPQTQAARLVNLDGFAHHMWMGDLVGGGDDADPYDLAAELVSAGLWNEVEGGWMIHDYHDYQRSKEQITRNREGTKNRVAKHRSARNTVINGGVTPPKNPNPKREPQKVKSIMSAAADSPLSKLLAELIVQNGSRRPRIGPKWLQAERLLVERDKRDPSEAAWLIRWCQGDDFWRANVLSMPKFRAKYDQLLLQAKRGQGSKPNPKHAIVAERVKRGVAAAERMRAS